MAGLAGKRHRQGCPEGDSDCRGDKAEALGTKEGTVSARVVLSPPFPIFLLTLSLLYLCCILHGTPACALLVKLSSQGPGLT